jgi:hypothetical protein
MLNAIPMSEEKQSEADEAAIMKALRIAELRAELSSLTGEPISQHLAENANDDGSDEMLGDLEAIESGEGMPRYDILQMRRNFTPVPLAQITHPAELKEQLWLLLYVLASMRTFIYDSNHLSDAELYQVLLNEVLSESTPMLSAGTGWNCRISICEISDKNDPDQSCHWRYYADEEERQWFRDNYPEDTLPAKEAQPFDRDDFLPAL